MIQNYTGELAALITAFFWTITALSFESAGKKVGSLAVNLIRLVLALVFYTLYLKITRGTFFPLDAGQERWLWLSLSGLVGFVFGDLLLFQSYVVISARVSMLVMSLTPPLAAITGWFVLDESLSLMNWIGMAVTLAGISIVILKREKQSENGEKGRRITTAYSWKGILLAFGGAVGQAVGLVLSKKGMGDYNAFGSAQIRVISGIAGFTVLFFIMNKWGKVAQALKHGFAMKRIALGSVFGPFLGVSFSLIAIQHTKAGIAATIMAIVPVLIIPPSILLFKEKVNWKEILGSIVTVGGVALFFL